MCESAQKPLCLEMAVTVKEGKGNKSSLVATVKKKFYMHRFHEFSIISQKREASENVETQNQEIVLSLIILSKFE